MAFADLNDVSLAGGSHAQVRLQAVLEERADDMKFFAERVDNEAMHVWSALFPRLCPVDYTDAVAILEMR